MADPFQYSPPFRSEPTESELERKRKTLDSLIAQAKEAHMAWRTNFSDGLWAIKRFLEQDAEDGECLESFDDDWPFGSFEINWRHLAGRKHAICYLPLYLPNDPGIRLRRPSELPQGDPLRRYCQDASTLIIEIKPKVGSPGPKRAREWAEANGFMEEWLK